MNIRKLLENPIIVGELETPTCGRQDCDVTENPEHWVSAELTPAAAAALKAFPLMLDALERMTPTCTCPSKESQALHHSPSCECYIHRKALTAARGIDTRWATKHS